MTLLFFPNQLFALIRLPPTDEVWIRVAGMPLFRLRIYYTAAGRNG